MAIHGAVDLPGATDAASGRCGDLTESNILLPVAAFLSGDVLLLGSASAGLRAEASNLARALTWHARLPAGTAPFDTPPSHDAVLAVDVPDLAAPYGRSGSGPRAVALARGLLGLRRSLRPDGRLILVMENAQAPRPGSGGQTVPAQQALPSYRADLYQALCEAGLPHQDWWFAFPDHRAARTLLSERGLSPASGLDAGALAGEACAARGAWRRLAGAGTLADHAPAFLIVAAAVPLPADRRLALHLGYERRAAFNKIATVLDRDAAVPAVLRRPRRPDLPHRVAGITNRFPDEDLAAGRPWPETLEAVLAQDGWDLSDIVAWGERWLTALRATFLDGGSLDANTILPAHALDAIPRNLLVAGEHATFIDLEWERDTPLDLAHLLVRGLLDTMLTIEVAGLPGRGFDPTFLTLLRDTAASLGLPLDDARLAEDLDREARFQAVVSGRASKRDLAWLAGRHLVPRADLLARADSLARTVTTLRTEHAEALRIGAEARRQTDSIIAYAAERDRAVERLETALARSEADRAEPRPPMPAARPGLGRWLRTRVFANRT